MSNIIEKNLYVYLHKVLNLFVDRKSSPQLQGTEDFPVFQAGNTNRIALFHGSIWYPLINPIAGSTGRDDLDTFVPLVQLNRHLAVEIVPPQYEIRLILLNERLTSRLIDKDVWRNLLFASLAKS